MFLDLKEGNVVIYLANMPYTLANGQFVDKEEEELIINSNVQVQSRFFKIKETPKKEKTVDEMNREELLKFAEDNNLDVDKRKNDAKLLAEIKEALKK